MNRAAPLQPWLDLTWADEDVDLEAEAEALLYAYWAQLDVPRGVWGKSAKREETVRSRALN